MPVHPLIQGPEPPSPGVLPFTLNVMIPCSRYSAFAHASPVRVTGAMQPYDQLPPLERALPYLVDTLYAELDSISRLLATRPPGSLSLGDVDVISHLIKVSSDFRAFLQQSRCCAYPAQSCTWPRAPSPPPTHSRADLAETFDTNEQESGIVLGTHVESREEAQFRPLDLHPSLAPLPSLHPKLAAKAIPSTSSDESKVDRKPRAGAWHNMFYRCTAVVRGLFKFSSRSN